MHGTTAVSHVESIVAALTQQITTMTETLVTWMLDQPRTLADLEQQVLPLLQHLGQTALGEVAALAAPSVPAPTIGCRCGHSAPYLRTRPAHVLTLLGPVTISRAYYHCGACGTGHSPLDAQLQICAGSRSAGLDELLALLGATQDSFAEATALLARLSLVHLSPTTLRDATQTLGAAAVAAQAATVQQVQAGGPLPQVVGAPPARLYIAMDGVLAHVRGQGWREIKVGCCYRTTTRPDRQRPHELRIHAQDLSYVAALCEAETFGWHLWCEAARRGVLAAEEVVVLGDGAHWVWRIAEELFPQATQILDWYHASEYLWAAATAIWGADDPRREPWAEQQLTALWAGEVEAVLAVLADHGDAGEAVTAAISYYTTHQGRMDYAAYRARGLQVGSGSVESACKQVVSARLKGPGMRWAEVGADGVAVLRALLKSGRWDEAVALRPTLQRGYRRRGGQAPVAAQEPEVRPCAGVSQAEGRRSAAAVARVKAELAQEAAVHPWRRERHARDQWAEEHARAAEAPIAQAA